LTAVTPFHVQHETQEILALISRLDACRCAKEAIDDAERICRLLSLYSFRSTQQAERLCTELTSRYRKDALALYGSAFLLHRQSDSCYLRLEQLLSLVLRAAALRLVRAGNLSLSHIQLTQSDGMLLHLLSKEAQQKTGG